MLNKLLTIFLLLALKICYSTDYKLEDYTYDPKIKSVLFFPTSGQASDQMQMPVITIAQSIPLVLQFDELGEEFFNYYAKIINCDAYWNQSTLQDLQYLNSYNEFNFLQYNYSVATFEKYIHYTFTVPKVKLSGNYVLVVYRDGNIDDPIITRRFIVTENFVSIGVDMKMGNGDKRYTHQFPDFTVQYPTYNIHNPNDVKVVVRQNGRWDNAYYNVRPQFAREVDKFLDYRYFANELAFPAGNEYRVFDTRSLQTKRLGINDILLDGKEFEVFVITDRLKSDKGYELTPDINGYSIVYKQETADGSYDGDYSWVNFSLKTGYKLLQPVYLFGQLTNWEVQSKYLMTYDEKDQTYKLKAKFKQGYYNYEYVTVDPKTKKPEHGTIEGDFSQANNFYEIIVYYTPFGSRSDLVIGYRKVQMN
jgi:hypothetical protein